MPATMNETMTAGPLSGTASWSTKKMPVPTVAPTPNIISWKVPKLRFRSGPSWPPRGGRIGLRRVSCPPRVVGRVAVSVMGASWSGGAPPVPRTAGPEPPCCASDLRHRHPDAALGGDLDRAVVPRVDVPDHAHAGVVGEHPLDLLGGQV